MKIAYVVAYYSPVVDGPGQVVRELAERLTKQGHEVHVYTSDSDKYKRIKIKEEIINGVHVHRCFNWFTLVNFATFWPSVLFRLKKDFDIIHNHVTGHSYVFFSTVYGKLNKIPVVHTTHCPWTTGFRPKIADKLANVIYHTITRLTFKWTKKIIAITPWELQFIYKYGGSKEKTVVIPNGMDNILFKKVNPNKFKETYDIPKDSKLILFFGRLNPTKGPDKLLLAFREIQKIRKDCFLVYVGPDEGMLQKIKEMSKDNKQIKILGPIREKPKIAEMYQSSDVYVLPSYREGLPLTLFEAMASGLPIVASPVNGIPYEMKDPENGFLVEYGNIDGIKDAILRIFNDKNLSKKMSENNIKKAKNYSWDIITDRTFKIYKELKN